MCLSDALAWLGSAFFPLRLPPLQVQENRAPRGRGTAADPSVKWSGKKLRNTWRKKWTPPRVRGHRTLKLNKTPAPTPTVQAQPQSADDQRGKTTWRNSSSREPATPDPSWPNTRASNHGPLYRTMWALLMELLALGGLLSGIHWKVNLGVWLGDWMRHGTLWSTYENHVQRHLVHALGGCRDSRCQVDISGPLHNKLASPVAQLMCPKMLVDPFVYRGCPYFFTTPMSAPFSIASWQRWSTGHWCMHGFLVLSVRWLQVVTASFPTCQTWSPLRTWELMPIQFHAFWTPENQVLLGIPSVSIANLIFYLYVS